MTAPADQIPAVLEPVARKVTRYHCPACGRSHASKARARDHIGRCWLNPEAKACKTCAFFEPAHTAFCDGAACPSCSSPEECLADGGPELDGRIRSGCPLWAERSTVDEAGTGVVITTAQPITHDLNGEPS